MIERTTWQRVGLVIAVCRGCQWEVEGRAARSICGHADRHAELTGHTVHVVREQLRAVRRRGE